MKIHNNSDLKFCIELIVGTHSYSTILDKRVRTTAEEIIAQASGVPLSSINLPKMIQLKVTQNNMLILDRPWIEKTTHVGCVFSDIPKAHVSFEEDTSSEASEPTEEMIRFIGDYLKEYREREPQNFRPSEEYSDEDYLYHLETLFLCKFGIDQAYSLMRPNQIKNAIKWLFA